MIDMKPSDESVYILQCYLCVTKLKNIVVLHFLRLINRYGRNHLPINHKQANENL